MIEMLDMNASWNTTIADGNVTATPAVYTSPFTATAGIGIGYGPPEATTSLAMAAPQPLYAVDASQVLAQMISNTTATVVDYASQWLASTITNVTIGGEEAGGGGGGSSTTATTPLGQHWDEFNRSKELQDLRPHVNGSGHNANLIITNADPDEDLHDCHPDNPNFNCSSTEFMEFILGPKTLPLYKALLVTILYGGIFITGILGNVLICVVIVRHQAMHTATNYYLFSLAVSDLIFLLFGLPTEIFQYWHQYPYLFGLPFCKFRAYISEACSYVSVFTIVAFSVERYLAICHPLHLYAMSGFKRALRIIALLWIISFLGAIPFGWLTEITYLYVPTDLSKIDESAFCVMVPPPNLYVFEISFVVFFLIPMLLIIYFYGRMGAKIRSRTTQQLGVQQGSMHRESRHQQSRKAVIRMLAAVVLTFFICWLPFHAQRLFYVYGRSFKYYIQINEWLFSITGFAYYVSCTVNPILYNVMSHRYRVAFKDTLCGRRKSVYYNNGFARDQSSFRETTVATSLGHNGGVDRGYGRSFRITNNLKDRSSIKSSNIIWKKAEFCTPLEKEIPEDQTVVNSTKSGGAGGQGNGSGNSNGTNAVVVCVDNGVNGRTKVFTESEAQESLLSQNNETCI